MVHLYEFFYSGSSRSFVSTSFALHANLEFSSLKHKLVVTTPLGKQILRNLIFKGCEILIDGAVLKVNLISLEMYDFDVILGIDWLSTHQASMDCFTKKVVFRKLRFLKLEFEGDYRILPTCVISTLETKGLLHKGCEAYLAHVVTMSTLEMTLKNVLIEREFSNVSNCCWDQLSFLYTV